jgi:hypothetical protein
MIGPSKRCTNVLRCHSCRRGGKLW